MAPQTEAPKARGAESVGEHWYIQLLTYIGAKVHRMITIYVRPRRTDRQTDKQTNEHHGNSAMIRSNERIAR